MAKIKKNWADFKTTIASKILRINMEQDLDFYYLIAPENGTKYYCDIPKEGTPAPVGSDQEDFELNYQADVNQPMKLKSPDGKEKVVSSSLPSKTVTCFTTCGDNITPGSEEIGSMAHRMEWDFSNTDNVITAPAGYKRKRIEVEFLDDIYIKEGTIYFHDAIKGSYVDLFVVCKAGKYYLKNDGSPALASVDTPVYHYVMAHPMVGSVPMGDELNTEQAMETAVTTDYKFYVEITVPDTDSVSHGVSEFECYRPRTMIL